MSRCENWDPAEHVTYMAQSKNGETPRHEDFYYVILDCNGDYVGMSSDYDCAIEKARDLGDKKRPWITAIPIKGVVIPTCSPDEIQKMKGRNG